MDDTYRSVNALQVAGFLGTGSAVNLLVEKTIALQNPQQTRDFGPSLHSGNPSREVI